MIELIKKELSIHGIIISKNGKVKMPNGEVPISHSIALYKTKAKLTYSLVEKLWSEASALLLLPSDNQYTAINGIDNIFIFCLQGLKRMVHLYPGLSSFIEIEDSICKALCKDINEFSYRTMSKVIEYKLGIEWVSHIIARNLYIKCLLTKYDILLHNKAVVVAKGVHGPYSNLDLPMQERVFEWSSISDEVSGREKDKQKQSRYTKGLEGYNDPYVNEGFIWREIKNEPFLWSKEGENPYPHRNLLWS